MSLITPLSKPLNKERKNNMNIKKLTKTAQTPKRGSEYAAGYDLYADIDCEKLIIPSGESVMIGTGISMEIPHGYFGAIYARSGLACKQGLRPANCTAVIDEDYRGEVKVCLRNDSKEDREVRHGDRIAQIVFQPYMFVEMNEVDELSDTSRGEGGFGSTGKS